jgi:hypothetical protein
MAGNRERMVRERASITLAVSRGGMGYCFTWRDCVGAGRSPFPATASAEGRLMKGGPSLWENIGAREAKTLDQGETLVSTHTRNICLGAWFICALLVCMASTTVWSDSDKTIVDLQRGLPEAPSRYHRPRAAHLYQYDKTEVDLAVPLPPQPAEEQRGSQRPATLPAPTPAPTTPPPPAPLPEGGR